MYNLPLLKKRLIDDIKFRKQQGCSTNEIESDFETTKISDFSYYHDKYLILSDLPQIDSYDYIEPNDLKEIKQQSTKGELNLLYDLTDMELFDKIYGGFLGRICGVILGRPVEKWDHKDIEKYLRGCDEYPLNNYFPKQSMIDGKEKKIYYERLKSTREYIKYAEADDDINYVLLGLQLIEKQGVEFSTLDIGYSWLDNIPINWIWGPERTAYINLARYTDGKPRYPEIDDKKLWEIAHYLNDHNESIGALIRGDIFGYVAPGLCELAATMAYKDAVFTHVKNGIYGEMFIAAAISAAFCTNNIMEIINAGLAVIPKNCRLAEAVNCVVQWNNECGNWEEVYKKIDEKFSDYDAGHVINNTAIIINGILSGKSSFEDTICITVMQGKDTDCNAATAGSIVGILNGRSCLPDKWTGIFNDTVHSAVQGESVNKISDTAKRIYNIAKCTVRQYNNIKYRYNTP